MRVPETGSKGRPAYSGLGVQKGGFLTLRFGHLGVPAPEPGLGPPSQTSVFGPSREGPKTSLLVVWATLPGRAAQTAKRLQNHQKVAFWRFSPKSKGVVRQTASVRCSTCKPVPIGGSTGYIRGRPPRTPQKVTFFKKSDFLGVPRFWGFWSLLAAFPGPSKPSLSDPP